MHLPAGRWTWLAALLLALPPAAADSTLQSYHLLPTEHDDQGRVDEPDFAATGVLGATVGNCIVSFNPLATPGLGRACVADTALPPAPGQSKFLAPGCTDDQGRQPSGLCALWSNGVHAASPAPGNPDLVLLEPGTVGTAGMGTDRAPGRFTPAKATAIRFLDLQVAASVPAGSMIELNRKTADLGLRDALGGVASELSSPVIPTAASLWAWYGVWQDRNGNGVVDHLGDNQGQASPGNEFRWVGGCTALSPAVCQAETGVVFPVWVWPGNHHGECGFAFGCYLPSDLPGKQAICFASVHVLGDPDLMRCYSGADFDAEERDADPLLGPAGDRISADGELRDGTAGTNNQRADLRRWYYGLVPAYYYDQSLLTTTEVIGGPTLRGKDPGLPTHYSLAALQFVDVDRYAAWAPVAGDLLQSTLRPSMRGPWASVRDSYGPLGTSADGALHHASVDAAAQPLAAADDALRDPGWSREPNHALDRFPAVAFRVHPFGGGEAPGEQDHRGWRNDYALHSAGWRAWADLQAERITFTYGKWSAGDACVQPFCQPGGGFWDGLSVLPGQDQPFPRPQGDHGRTLDPGAYQFRGYVGAWRDRPAHVSGTYVDLAASLEAGELRTAAYAETLPPDGWIGNVVNTTGAFRHRGYGDEACFLHGQPQLRAWAVCHPYADAATARASTEEGLDQSFGLDLTDPQDYADAGEFQVLTTPPQASRVVLRPAGGTWTFPVFVMRDFYDWQAGDITPFQDLTGTTQPIVLDVLPQLHPALRSKVVTEDVLILPVGTLGQGLTSEFAFRVRIDVPTRGIAVDETVVDVDAYRGTGIPSL